MSTSIPDGQKLEGRLKRSTQKLFIWTFVWLLSTALVAFGPKLLWDFNIFASSIALAMNVLLGIKMIWANKQHLEEMDEMQQKIQFNAMAVSLAATFVLGTAYGLLKPAGLLASTPSPSNIMFVMGISYIVTLIINTIKYQ
ncbi:MAG: hypothetical protein MI746_10320 [Pseudomonadales bacterium]|nr:hypothetical protein [Pseudomonadales bacterium]